jgi:thiamine pyrophosphate-dependent acetolactate synthase large subunit-like protein
VYVDLPFDVALSPQNGNPPVPALVSLPVDVSNQEVPGAARAVKADMSSV